MLLVEFKCTRCGRRFELEVYEKGEAETRQVCTSPARCPACSSVYLDRVRERPLPNRPR